MKEFQNARDEELVKYSRWCRSVGIEDLDALNEQIRTGNADLLVNLSEARHERRFAQIADYIKGHADRARIVLLAGPSSSGKTSSSLRIALQCKVLGLSPKVIELDNYFVDRDKTPRDENGDYDFEALEAMDLDLLGRQLNALLAGERVEIPRFDFKEGRPVYEGNFLQLGDNDILIMEGIHALNPAMVPSVDQSKIIRIYVSALTSLSIEKGVPVEPHDCRLLRRIARDNRTRGISPEDNILRWESVRRGEQRNILPFRGNADIAFNSASLYNIPVLKYYCQPLLEGIGEQSPAYAEAQRLLGLLSKVETLPESAIASIPPISIIREFVGGQARIV